MLSKLQNTDASMPKALIAFLVFTALLWNNAQVFANIAADCCLSTSEIPIPRRIVESYFIQNTDGGCAIPATVFITKKNRKLCAPPAYDNFWVIKLIEFLNARSIKKNEAQSEMKI